MARRQNCLQFIYMKQSKNPKWWNEQHQSAWDRVKAAFKRDWDQTQHDLGGKKPDTEQDLDDTVKQAAGKQPIPPRGQRTYEDDEDAYRFGHSARAHYRIYKDWDDNVEAQLRHDWEHTYADRHWNEYRNSIRIGWDRGHSTDQDIRKAA